MTNRLAATTVIVLGILCAACVASAVDGSAVGAAAESTKRSEPDGERTMARTTSMAKSATLGRQIFESREIVARKSMPPQFELQLTKQMPTPGWTFDVAVDVDEPTRRIVATVREIGPDGLSAQVMTDTVVRVPLGTLRPGAWFVELLVARGDGRPAPADAFVLHAR